MEKIYFTGGVNVIDNELFGICRILQEKVNELVEGYNEMMERFIRDKKEMDDRYCDYLHLMKRFNKIERIMKANSIPFKLPSD